MDSTSEKQFLPLESDPEMMNVYLKNLGIPNPKVAFYDVFGVDPELMAMVPKPVRAFLLLFPITGQSTKEGFASITAHAEEAKNFHLENKVFFSFQFISNACGTMGILHAVLNNLDYVGDVVEGTPIDLLRTKKDAGASRDEMAKAICSSDDLEKAHQEASLMNTENVNSIDVATDLHFTCFVHIKDRCVELDGRFSFPRLHGSCRDNEEFIAAASAAISERMEQDPGSIRYNIIAMSDIPTE